MQSLAISDHDFKIARSLIEKGAVRDIAFSSGTYQIEIQDEKKNGEFWPFLQIDDTGKLKDHFCTCEEAEVRGSCIHLAAGWLKIFSGGLVPLHVRFRDSLWNKVCQIASRRHGYDFRALKGDVQNGLEAHSLSGKCLFRIKPLSEKGAKRLEDLVLKKEEETEETSLKFSNLPLSDLKLWRAGSPPSYLKYELSFWSDLAKWLILCQEEGDYSVEFGSYRRDLPTSLSVKFADVALDFYIAEANWPQLIPSLSSISSSLKTFEFVPREMKTITYDSLNKSFHLLFEQDSENSQEETRDPICIGEWNFVQGKGFYPKRADLLFKDNVVPKEEIAHFLQKYSYLVQKHLVGEAIYLLPVKVNYDLLFDAKHHLHINAFVFQSGDLSGDQAGYFGPWVYVPGKGFYQLENLLFDGTEKVILRSDVSDFISRHRHWLHSFTGFATHVSSVQSYLKYSLSLDSVLTFDVEAELQEEDEEVVDLDNWIYIKGKGFYAKAAKRTNQKIKPGLCVLRKEIPQFIRSNREELENVSNFFSMHVPLSQIGLNVYLNEHDQIFVEPSYVFNTQDKPVTLFEDFTYVEEEGFCEIPSRLKLPLPYYKTTRIEKSEETQFLNAELDLLRPYILKIDERLKKPKQIQLRIFSIEKEETADRKSWLATLCYESEIGQVSAYSVWERVKAQDKYMFSRAGLISLKNPRFNWLKDILKKGWLQKGTQVRLSTIELMRLFVFEDILEPDDEHNRQLINHFKHFLPSEPINLNGFNSSLRNYQETGLKWLWFLYSYGLSGLLCDEMGLGKTHQAMALLSAAANYHTDGKFLVVCPTSVIYHWQELLNRFSPKLRVKVFYGIQRSLDHFDTDFDLLLTSYGTLRSEKKQVSELKFEISVFDEIQIAKNHQSRTHKTLKVIQSNTKIGLTGTPIENRLLELKSLFDIVLPGYMPAEGAFKEMFINPIEKEHDAEKKNYLSQFIKPFILRRKKAEVLLELPEKIEEIAHVELSAEQKELYRSVYGASKESILNELQDVSKPTPYLHIFSLLSKLKQICDHPSVYLGDVEDYKSHECGKWDLFVELLQEARASSQKLVVFSQYLNMLNIIEKYLTEEGIGFAAIRGSTRNRKEQMEKFRDDPACEVFVGSLQAAGVGIDLVSASVVIHYDRWWNAARENQATDRVHRIGQNRGVQVFKMVTRASIEEHIHLLIEKKKGLMESVVGYDDQDHVKSLSREELFDLLEALDGDVGLNK